MRIEFKKLFIKNFLSLGSIELSLDNRGYTLISGINKNPSDMAKSNGSGKTAIFDAILWCLTGETTRGISSNIANIYVKEGCKVELIFTYGNNSYHIIRTRDYEDLGNCLKIFINDEDKSGKGLRDTEQLLKEYLPDITPQLLNSVIILGQGLPQRFTNNSPSGRKEVLEKLSKSDFMIEDIKSKIINRQNLIQNNLRKCEDSILANKSKIESLTSILNQNIAELNNIKSEDYYDNSLKELNQNIYNINKNIEDANNIYDINCKNTLNIEQQLLDLKSKLQKEITFTSSEIDSQLNKYFSDIIINNNEINHLQEKINNINNIKEICPTCGQRIPGVYKPDLTQDNKLLEELKGKSDKINFLIEELKNKKSKEIDNINKKYQEQITEKSNLKIKLEEDIFNQKSSINDLIKNKNDLDKLLLQTELDKKSLLNNREKLKDQIAQLSKEINELNKKILYVSCEEKDYQNRLNILNKILTIAKRDFRGYLLGNLINFINLKAKEYCKDIFNNDCIVFELDKNNINILYNNKPYENLSGGEKQKIDIIIQFSIRDMLCKFSNFSSNIIALDEIFDNIDSVGCEKIINLISTKLNDIESIFIITHHSDIPISADSNINIVKNEQGISYLE